MSALGSKADPLEQPSVCPLIARSGHWQTRSLSEVTIKLGINNLRVPTAVVAT